MSVFLSEPYLQTLSSVANLRTAGRIGADSFPRIDVAARDYLVGEIGPSKLIRGDRLQGLLGAAPSFANRARPETFGLLRRSPPVDQTA